jgi:HPt (histidine-containing phosphotransfer) domain-containing protein
VAVCDFNVLISLSSFVTQERTDAPGSAEQIAGLSSFVDLGEWPLLDTRHAVAVLGDDDVAYREVAQVFLDHLPAAVEALRSGYAPDELLPVVHELGSSLGAVGALRAHRVARAIEQRWRRGQLDDAARSTALLRAVVDASAAALSAALTRPEGGAS